VSLGCRSEQDVCGWVFVSKETVCVFSVWSLGRELCYLLGLKALPWSTSSQTGSRLAGKKRSCGDWKVLGFRRNKALSNLAWWKVSLPMVGGLELDGL